MLKKFHDAGIKISVALSAAHGRKHEAKMKQFSRRHRRQALGMSSRTIENASWSRSFNGRCVGLQGRVALVIKLRAIAETEQRRDGLWSGEMSRLGASLGCHWEPWLSGS